MPKISALDTIETIGEADQLPINDVSAVSTKKITVGQLLSQIYPVGSIYTNAAVPTNPAELMGFGTWEAFGAGRVPVGIDPSQAEFDTAEETGGSMTHTHQIPLQSGYDTSKAFPYSSASFEGIVNEMGASIYSKAVSSRTRNPVAGSNGAANIEVWRMQTAPVSNLQPYITVYMWKRTA